MARQATQVTEDPAAIVQRYLAAFNRADEAGMADCFSAPGVILDGMPPHVWSGPSAAEDWWRDMLAEGEYFGVSDYFITLGEPLHNDVAGDAAYIVAPATMTFQVRGHQVNLPGALLTVALRKLDEGWRIAGWAWAKGKDGD